MTVEHPPIFAGVVADLVVDHRPGLFSSRFGAWCRCSCGRWESGLYTTVTGAHLAFGRHLLRVEAAGYA